MTYIFVCRVFHIVYFVHLFSNVIFAFQVRFQEFSWVMNPEIPSIMPQQCSKILGIRFYMA